MEIFSSVAAAIGLAAKLKSTFEQAGYNKDDGITLCSDIQASLLRIDDYLKYPSASSSDGLYQDLSQFEKELKRILGHQEVVTKQSADGMWDRSTTKSKDLYNVGDVKHSLEQLFKEIQVCQQNLQLSCSMRMDQNIESLDRQLRLLVDALIPSSDLNRMAVLDRIEENIQDCTSVLDTEGALAQDIERIRTMNASQVALSIKSAKFSLSLSIIEKGFLKRKVKELARTLPQLGGKGVKQSSLLWFRDPFKGLVVWGSGTAQARSKEESIRETLRILTILRSEKRILYVNAARDIFALGRALGHLGMREEASVMYEWGLQICREIAGADNPRMLFNLAQFLDKLFVDLVIRGQFGDGHRVLEHAVEVRAQLGKVDRDTYMAEQASILHCLGDSSHREKRYEDAVNIYQEAVAMRRGLTERNRNIYLPDLALSMHELGLSVYSTGQYEDAVKLQQETIIMCQELVERNQDTYLPALAESVYSLGASVHSAGRYEDAVKILQEAVTMHRELVERNRDIYLPGLASSLHSLGYSVYSAGRDKDAVNLQQDAVTMRRELVERNQSIYLPGLASSLYNLGAFVHSVGRYMDAVKLLQETVAMHRELVEKDRDTYLPDLASSLHSLGYSMHSAGQHEDAVKLEQEAIIICRELVEKNRATVRTCYLTC